MSERELVAMLSVLARFYFLFDLPAWFYQIKKEQPEEIAMQPNQTIPLLNGWLFY